MYQFVNIFERWQARTKLVSSADVENIVSKHISESIQFMSPEFVDFKAVLDIGSGGGFPGIPMAVLRPDCSFVLVDSKRLKTLFLQEAVELMEIKNVEVVCSRVEKLCFERSGQFDVVTARAVADLKTLWMWSEPLLKPTGVLLAQKGGEIDREVEGLPETCIVKKQAVFEDKTKVLLIIKKG
ncbi:MAG: 16S rRNA (guanine(527)-N(7))-methyltransferase RsmG [candidate division KSB1 bacterium]|nr:16S rRNA (guanine(527)-N(7))-methyltransferase RsmG [candidate division KSB1 bacterium]